MRDGHGHLAADIEVTCGVEAEFAAWKRKSGVALESLLAKVHAALVPGGRAVVLGLIPNDDRISPPANAAFSLTLLATTTGSDAYTFAELDRMFRNAGFAHRAAGAGAHFRARCDRVPGTMTFGKAPL